ncbi:sugar phosphorylase [Claveliimonas bilis]|uniref:sugar phosphorylase n=1 Tax=Claveliimonas bilis TaxID=3028070 RepID=UPI0029308C8C|nr:sugar phosphorylase [Claveliimonas bilis]BDZ80161.1 sucrose phosphorylase [Claveliimonas bilis]
MEKALEEVLKRRLSFIYKDEEKQKKALHKIAQNLDKYENGAECTRRFSQADSILITYGDTIIDGDRPGLQVLEAFLKKYVKNAINAVHILPMYPYTSDDGFSVTDYRKINPRLGNWNNIKQLSQDYSLMFDAVINHISKSSEWFQRYLKGEDPYKDYFITCDPNEDYSSVTRPRALPLLTKVETVEGEKFVWTTFSDDQIDLNFECPELLAEVLDILMFYAENGAKYIRLDAIGFMWKELGTSCMHLSQTHEIIKLMKDVLRAYFPEIRIVTETNVPHEDNISYFGNGYDEADLVYQFPLPPLTMFSLLTGNAEVFAKWMERLSLPSDKVTYFNFLSSHDGIGVRPTEGILTREEQQILVDAALKNGGAVSYKDNGDGTQSPYELNINYQDALAGPDASDEERIAKFLAAETILLSLQGIPGIYIHSLLGSRNDYYGKTVSGIPRRINREKLSYDYIEDQLREETNRKRIFDELIRRLNIRKGETAFSPTAGQEVRKIDPEVLTFIRSNEETGERIWVLINVTGKDKTITEPQVKGKNLLGTGENVSGNIRLKPWECAWVKEQ